MAGNFGEGLGDGVQAAKSSERLLERRWRWIDGLGQRRLLDRQIDLIDLRHAPADFIPRLLANRLRLRRKFRKSNREIAREADRSAPVPDLTPSWHIKLNGRVSLRPLSHALGSVTDIALRRLTLAKPSGEHNPLDGFVA